MIDLTTGWWYGYKTLDLLEEVNRRLDNNGDNKLTKDQAIRSLIPMLYTNAHVFVEKPIKYLVDAGMSETSDTRLYVEYIAKHLRDIAKEFIQNMFR